MKEDFDTALLTAEMKKVNIYHMNTNGGVAPNTNLSTQRGKGGTANGMTIFPMSQVSKLEAN